MNAWLSNQSNDGPGIPSFLRPLRSVLLAVIDCDGRLVDANQGFATLASTADCASSAQDLRPLFINPTFDALLRAAEQVQQGEVFAGCMTLGDVDGESETWVGGVCRHGAYLMVVCERDVEQDRQLQRQLLALTEDYAEQERALVRANRALCQRTDEIERLLRIDMLTNLSNRRHFNDLLAAQIETARRYGEPLSLLLLDLDAFKEINDTHGHLLGDEALQTTAATLDATRRAADVVARWGGEEFISFMPNTDEAGAAALAERLRRAVATMETPGALPAITSSIGVAQWQAGESIDELVGRADNALYQAKHDGRNRVVIADGGTGGSSS